MESNAKNKSANANPSLFIRNLDYKETNESLTKALEDYGPLKFAYVVSTTGTLRICNDTDLLLTDLTPELLTTQSQSQSDSVTLVTSKLVSISVSDWVSESDSE